MIKRLLVVLVFLVSVSFASQEEVFVYGHSNFSGRYSLIMEFADKLDEYDGGAMSKGTLQAYSEFITKDIEKLRDMRSELPEKFSGQELKLLDRAHVCMIEMLKDYLAIYGAVLNDRPQNLNKLKRDYQSYVSNAKEIYKYSPYNGVYLGDVR